MADEYQPEQDKRWVLVAPPGAGDNAATLLVARAATPEKAALLGSEKRLDNRQNAELDESLLAGPQVM